MSSPAYLITPASFLKANPATFVASNGTIGKVIVDTSAANISATPPLYGGCTILELLARSTDSNNRIIQLYKGAVITTVGANTGTTTITSQNSITRTAAGYIADGWLVGDQLMLLAPTAKGSTVGTISGVEGVLCTVTAVTDTVLTVSGTPLTNTTVTSGYRICRVVPHFRSNILALAGSISSGTIIPNYSLLNNGNDSSAVRNEMKFGPTNILVGAMTSTVSALPAYVSVSATIALY